MTKEILIADSEKSDQEEFQKIFQTTDYRVIFAENGEEALLRAQLFKPDIIIASQENLRQMDGSELCGAVKGNADLKHIPFILIKALFNEISDNDRKRSMADEMIQRPFREDEVLSLVRHLMEEEEMDKREKIISDHEGSLSTESDEEDKGVIELFDVLEEPEPIMSIDNFVVSGSEEPPKDVPVLESLKNIELEYKIEPEAPTEETEWTLPAEQEKPPVPAPRTSLNHDIYPEEGSSELGFFSQSELEAIINKVEQLKPVAEKEWSVEQTSRPVTEEPSKKEVSLPGLADLKEFETVLQTEEMGKAKTADVTRSVFSLGEADTAMPPVAEESMEKIMEEAFSVEGPIEESLEEEKWGKVLNEGFQGLPSDVKESIDALMKKPFSVKESIEEPLEEEKWGEGLKEEPLEEEKWGEGLKEEPLEEEKWGKGLKEESLEEEKWGEGLKEEPLGEELTEEDIHAPKSDEGMFEEMMLGSLKSKGFFQEEGISAEPGPRGFNDRDVLSLFEEEKLPPLQEISHETQEILSPPQRIDNQLEEVMSKGIQETVRSYITKLLPEMTHQLVGLTAARIEKMVKDVVPGLAEKAIIEEIKRLQKGEKD